MLEAVFCEYCFREKPNRCTFFVNIAKAVPPWKFLWFCGAYTLVPRIEFNMLWTCLLRFILWLKQLLLTYFSSWLTFSKEIMDY